MQPKTKTQEAYEYLQSYQGLTSPNNLQFYRWLQDAQHLLETSAADGYVLQGFAYMLLGNAESAIDSMKKAKNLNHYYGKVNYTYLLSRFGEYKKSAEICIELLRQYPTDAHVFSIALDNADFALDANLAEKIFALFQGDYVYQNDGGDLNTFLSSIDDKNKLLTDVNIDKDKFIDIKKRLFQFLSRHYYGNYVVRPFIAENEIGKHLDLNIYLNNVGIDDCLELTDKFMDELVDDDNLNFDDYKNIITHFIPAKYDKVV